MKSIYLTDEKLENIATSLDMDDNETFYEFVEDATSEMEAKLSIRYKIPLTSSAGPLGSAPEYTRTFIGRTLKAFLVKVIALDAMKNMGESEGAIYYNAKVKRAKELSDQLLDEKRDFGLALNAHSSNFKPTQTIHLARPDSDFEAGFNV